MKRLVKALLRKAWGWTAVVREPIVRRQDEKLTRMLGELVREPIARHLHTLDVAHHEMNIALNSCVREIARLEMQVEELRLELEHARERPAHAFDEAA